MGEFSKFKALTVVIILLFIFSIAAMYTNTKEAAEKKLNENNKTRIEKKDEELHDLNIEENNEQTEETNSEVQIQRLSDRITILENTVSSLSNSQRQQELKCNIRGIVNSGEIVPLSAQEAITEARSSGKDIVITCGFN